VEDTTGRQRGRLLFHSCRTIRLRGSCRLDGREHRTTLLYNETPPPHLVALDIQLGPDIVRRLRLEYPDFPVFILTDIGKHPPGHKGLRPGARRCFMKPFQIEGLLEGIKECLGITSLDTAWCRRAAARLPCLRAFEGALEGADSKEHRPPQAVLLPAQPMAEAEEEVVRVCSMQPWVLWAGRTRA
jgi:DNA-binding NarL/FixJ family response regulator